MIYHLKYKDVIVARVEVSDTDVARGAIKEMVEFWMGWEMELDRDGGDYTRCFLRRLTNYILTFGEPPQETEGWYPLDGSWGIKVLESSPWEFDTDQISIDLELTE